MADLLSDIDPVVFVPVASVHDGDVPQACTRNVHIILYAPYLLTVCIYCLECHVICIVTLEVFRQDMHIRKPVWLCL